MAIFSVNIPNRTVTIHKDNCKVAQNAISEANISQAVYGIKKGKNQIWFDENNITLAKIQTLFNGRDFCKIFCSQCF